MTICKETTFKELKKMVGSTADVKKLPSAKKLRSSKAEIVFDGDVTGAHFTIYRNGLYIYSRDGHATVYAVDRCTEIPFETEIDSDYDKALVTAGCTGKVKLDKNGRKYLLVSVPESEFQDGPWNMPLDTIGSIRLDHNQESREENHCEIHLDNNGDDWEEKTFVRNFADVMEEEEEEKELLERMDKAVETLTACQKKAVNLRYIKDMKQKDVAEKMGCSQPMAYKHINAALKNLRKKMGYKNN